MFVILCIISICIADQRYFVWTYEYKTVSRGEAEFEHYYTTSYPNSSDLANGTKVGHQLELEIGMNERFDFAVYHQFEQQDGFTYKGYKLRGRYRLGEQNQYFMDPLLYLEYHGKPDFSEHGFETKLILAKETNNIIASFNPVLEIEIEDDEKGTNVVSSEIENTDKGPSAINLQILKTQMSKLKKIKPRQAIKHQIYKKHLN